MAHVKDLTVVKDDLQILLGGLAKELNRRIYGEGVFRGGLILTAAEDFDLLRQGGIGYKSNQSFSSSPV